MILCACQYHAEAHAASGKIRTAGCFIATRGDVSSQRDVTRSHAVTARHKQVPAWPACCSGLCWGGTAAEWDADICIRDHYNPLLRDAAHRTAEGACAHLQQWLPSHPPLFRHRPSEHGIHHMSWEGRDRGMWDPVRGRRWQQLHTVWLGPPAEEPGRYGDGPPFQVLHLLKAAISLYRRCAPAGVCFVDLRDSTGIVQARQLF